MIERAVEQRPNDGAIIDSLGWVMLRQGDTDGAVKSLEHAVELLPEDATINGHLGDAYWAAGRRQEALFQWRRALNLNPEPEDVPKLEAKLRESEQALGIAAAAAGAAGHQPGPLAADRRRRPRLRRGRAGQGQPVPARRRPPRRRLPSARQPGGVPRASATRCARRRPTRCRWRWRGRSAAPCRPSPTIWCCAPRAGWPQLAGVRAGGRG